MTELAYLADMESAYVRSFRARIVGLPPGGLVLDRTYFYPAGGGQPYDRGKVSVGVATLDVVDVVRVGASVQHRVRGSDSAKRTFALGGEVEGELDWERRHRHMRLHTGQHLLSACVFLRSGLRTRRAVLAGSEATIELEGSLSTEELDEVSAQVRSVIREARPVRVRTLPRAEWEGLPEVGRSGLVPLPSHVDPVRVVEIDGVDNCPCGGTHVRSTGEIEAVSLHPPTVLPGGGSRIGFSLASPEPPSRPG